MNKKRALVVCPGRGTYNKPDLGYWHKYHRNKRALLDDIDAPRLAQDQVSIAALDNEPRYNRTLHTAGEHASTLIYGCAAGDFSDINRDKYDIVGITGNSMGWYIALALGGGLNISDGAELIHTMGSMMTDGLVGGQLIYPVSDSEWQSMPSIRSTLQDLMNTINQRGAGQVYLSIDLGGYWVMAGDEPGLSELESKLDRIDDTYPMRLFNHAAFHSPLLTAIAERGQRQLPVSMFNSPSVPLIDGDGHIWQPYSTEPASLWQYTLGKQVVATYHFNKAITVAVKEFAPDVIIVLGPGTTLSGSVAQSLVRTGWDGITSKTDFVQRQNRDPLVLAMAIPEQRALVIDQTRQGLMKATG